MALNNLTDGDILLVGEGDFSFTVAFIESLLPQVKVTATSLLSFHHLMQLHKMAVNNIDILCQKGVDLLYEIDATKLEEAETLQNKQFDRIIFNFPHVGGKSNIRKNRELLGNFFDSAVRKMVDTGDICVTFAQGQGGTPADRPFRSWYDSWQSVAIAAESNLVLTDTWPFLLTHYPHYNSTGFRSQDRSFCTGGALTYVFKQCRPIYEPSPELVPCTVTVSDVSYGMRNQEITRHMNRCVFKQTDHPVHLVLQHLGTIAAQTAHRLEHIDLPLVVCSPTGQLTQGYTLNLLDKYVSSLSSSNQSNRTDNNIITSHPSTVTEGDEKNENNFLRRSFLDCITESRYPAGGEKCIYCCYGEVFRRRAAVDCQDLPYKNELLLFSNGDNDHDDDLTSMIMMTKHLISTLLENNHNQVMISLEDSDSLEPWLIEQMEPWSIHSITITGASSNQLVTCACNQVKDTGKSTIPCSADLQEQSVKSSRVCGYLGTTKDACHAVILDIDVLCQIKYDIPDARLLWSADHRFLNQFKNLCPVNSYHFKSISLYPPLWRHDVSFWLNPTKTFQEEEFLDIVQDIGREALKCVLLMNVWRESATGRISRCYRQVYQSYQSAVSYTLAHELNDKIRACVAERMGVELR